jgi:hypothetical protein
MKWPYFGGVSHYQNKYFLEFYLITYVIENFFFDFLNLFSHS